MISTRAFERYQTGDSPIHRLDPRVKLLVTISYIVSTTFYPDGAWPAFFLAWVLLLGAISISRVRFEFVLKRSALALPFALAAATILFTLQGSPLVQLRIGDWQLTISDAGLIRFLSILVRSWLSVQAAILLTTTTTFPDMAHGLRHLGLPQVLIAIISFMYRYLFILVEEAERLLRARAARSALPPGGESPPLSWRAKVAGHMVGNLFLRSYERSERVYQAMVARGFQGQFLTFTPHTIKPKDWYALILSVLTLIGLQLAAHTA